LGFYVVYNGSSIPPFYVVYNGSSIPPFYVVYNGSSIPFYVVYNGSSIPPFQEEASVPSTRVEQSNAFDINVTFKHDELLNLWLRWAEN